MPAAGDHDPGGDAGGEALASLGTETVDDRFGDIDQMSALELATTMNDADTTVAGAVRTALAAIAAAVDGISGQMRSGGRLIYVGAGTSGRLGLLDASECPPTFGTSPAQVVAIMAGGVEAFATPREGAEDDRDAGIDAIDACGAGRGDAVVGIAASGRTPFVLAAIERARELGAVTIGLSCNRGAPLSALVDHPIEVPVGAEVVAGSTRLRAGTAQKLVLNMLSTITMVRLGKTYGNLMVDVRPTNVKLRARATGLVARIAQVDDASAAAAMAEADNDVKVAVLVARHGIAPERAAALLAASDGRLRDALAAAGAAGR